MRQGLWCQIAVSLVDSIGETVVSGGWARKNSIIAGILLSGSLFAPLASRLLASANLGTDATGLLASERAHD